MKRSAFRLTDREFLRFIRLAKPVAGDERVRRMKEYVQHGDSSTYDHCLSVAYTAFLINRRLHIGAREESLVRAALLHDYFLYDWHDKGDKLHGYHHPAIASANAGADFDLSDIEMKMIESHMWPLTLMHIPTSRAGWVLTIADKICSSKEVVSSRYLNIKKRVKEGLG
jgi:uncharacterized protein